MLVHDSAAKSASGPVGRILYASVSLVTGSIYAEMEKIRASAVRHNEPVGVSTALLYQAGWFLQWKEGPGDALLRIMERVARDARHRDLHIVHSSRGPRLLDGPWSMAVVHGAERPEDLHQRLLALRQGREQGVQFSPLAIWRRLSTPMRHPGAHRPGDPDAFQRVLVCAAAGTGSFDLVRRLAALHHEEVVHRRFFGKQDLDVGTDCVDFVCGGRVLRLLAMARNGLQLPITRAFLADYSHLVLLLCGDPRRDDALVDKVARACMRLERPPVLVAVAQRPHWHVAPESRARSFGLRYLPSVVAGSEPEATWVAVAPLLRDGTDVNLEGAGQQDALVDLADVGAAAEGH